MPLCRAGFWRLGIMAFTLTIGMSKANSFNCPFFKPRCYVQLDEAQRTTVTLPDLPLYINFSIYSLRGTPIRMNWCLTRLAFRRGMVHTCVSYVRALTTCPVQVQGFRRLHACEGRAVCDLHCGVGHDVRWLPRLQGLRDY